MNEQTEQRLLKLAARLPALYVPLPQSPGPPPSETPQYVPFAPDEPEPELVAKLPADPPLEPRPSVTQWYTPKPSATAVTEPDLSRQPQRQPSDIIPGMAVPPRRGHRRGHARPVTRYTRRRLLILAGLILIPLVVVGVILGMHYASSAPPPAPVLTPSPTAVPSPAAATGPAGSPALRSSMADVPGVPAVFAACVAFTASGDGTASHNIYGITRSSGINVTGYSLARQKAAFSTLYKRYGPTPWKSYGCTV